MQDTHLDIRSYGEQGQTHHHDHHQLVLPLAGKLVLQVDTVGGEVAGTQAAIIAAGRDHGFASPADNRFLVADVPQGLAPALDRLPCFVQLDPSLLQYVAFLQQELVRSPASAVSQRQMLLLLIQLLQERHGGLQSMDRRVSTAKAYLDEHFQHKLTLETLAGVAHLSVRQLNELFRRQIGITPHHYLTEVRMQQAWQLLEGTDLSVQAVAERVGYGSLAAFSDRFHQHFGHPPSHFRRTGKTLRQNR